MKFRLRLLLALAGMALGLVLSLRSPSALSGAPDQDLPSQAYFQFHYPPDPETFIVELDDPALISAARAILAGDQPNRAVMGVIRKQPAPYNHPWSFHLDPASIRFFTNAIEVCDASIAYVEAHLDEVCGAFLPGCEWCPWGARLTTEIHHLYLPLQISGQ
jgi:hypothetical protein